MRQDAAVRGGPSGSALPSESDDLEFGQVLAVDEAGGFALGVDHDEVVDFVGLEKAEGIHAESGFDDGFGGTRHEGADGFFEKAGAGEGAAAEVAVGEDTGEFAGFGMDDGDAAALGLGHREDGLLGGGFFGDDGEAFAAAHDVFHAEKEDAAEVAGGVELGEVVAGESAFIEKHHGEGVAEREGGGGAGGRGEQERAGLARHAVDELQLGVFGEIGGRVAGEGDGLESEAAEAGDEAEDFLGLTAVAQEEHKVALVAEAEVAVEGLGGVEEAGGDTGAIKRADELVGDVGGFADAGEDEFAAGLAGGVDGEGDLDKRLIQAAGGGGEGFLFGFDRGPGAREGGFGVEGHLGFESSDGLRDLGIIFFSFKPFPLPSMKFRLVPLCLCALAAMFFVAGCGRYESSSFTAEIDEPGYRRGKDLIRQGRNQEALAAFLKVVEKRGDDAPESHLELGILYQQHIKDPIAAIYHYRKFRELKRNSPQSDLVRQRIDAATREFAKTLPAQPLDNQMERIDLLDKMDQLQRENLQLKEQLIGLRTQAVNANPAVETPAPLAVNPMQSPIMVAEDPVPAQVEPVPVPMPQPAPLPTPVPQPVPAQTSGSFRRHVVAKGDTLFSLAQRYYGNKSRWRDIYAANRNVMASEGSLSIGMELRIPQ